MNPSPFAVLGLPERPDLDDETVRAAWRAIAAATHPDRADGGDLARYTRATAAYAELRTPWGRSEAYADLAEQARREGRYDDRTDPGTEPLPAIPAVPGQAVLRPFSPWRLLFAVVWLPSRIGRGRPLRLLIRAAVTAGLSLAVLALIPGQPAAPADVAVLITWFALTGRKDLAPPPER
ncbi:MAG TPA: hypothetical protein VK280_03425 [Streptosporangiaceae bacterium]|nr:hypothetical protein [Streptosporangiaceae bacterium]